MPTFSLVDEPWIPVVIAGTPEKRDINLRDALVNAHDIVDIAPPSPIVAAALYRFLLAVLHRAYDGPVDAGGWWTNRDAGAFDEARIEAYLERWRERFDLFHPERPFYQTPDIDIGLAKPSGILFHETKVENEAALFNRAVAGARLAVPPAEAARQLIMLQSLSLGGLITHQKHEPANPFKYSTAAPLVNVATFFATGSTLFDTLSLNLHCYNPEGNQPFEGMGKDLPAWERDGPASVRERAPGGLTDLLTWQSRRVLLNVDDAGQVTGAAIMKGESLPDGYVLQGKEPMAAFRKRRTAKDGEPWDALRFAEDRALWRDSLAFIGNGKESARPMLFGWLSEVGLSKGEQLHVRVLGMASNKAKPDFWRDERLDVPAPFFGDDVALLGALELALRLAEDVGALLEGGFVEWIPPADKPGAAASGTKTKSGKPIRAEAPLRQLTRSLTGNTDKAREYVREALGGSRAYWAALDSPFGQLLADLAALPLSARDRHGAIPLDAAPFLEWTTTLRRAAEDAFNVAVGGLLGSARGIAAVGEAEHAFRWHLRRILAPNKEEVAV